MELSRDLIKEFAKTTNDEPTINEGTTVYGTFRFQDGTNYVQIDGSDTRTPVASTVTAKNGDRVTVLIKDHRAIVTGNLEDPSASSEEVSEVKKSIGQTSLDIEDLKTKLENQEITIQEYDEAIAEAKRKATDYINFTEGTGLVIGSSSISNNVRIYAGGIDIREGQTILASYTDSAVYLGLNSIASTINMCAGECVISAGLPFTIIPSITETMIKATNGCLTIASSGASMIFLPENESYPHGGNIFTEKPMNIAEVISNNIHTEDGENYITALQGYNYYASKDHGHSGNDIYGGYPTVNSIYLTNPGTASQVALYRSTNSGIIGIPLSSERYKNSITNVTKEDLLPERLYDLPVRQFKWNEGHYPEEEHYDYNYVNVGFIAEEVAEHYPFAAVIMDGKIETWEVRGIVPPMLALIQEQKREIDLLKERIELLEGKEVS